MQLKQISPLTKGEVFSKNSSNHLFGDLFSILEAPKFKKVDHKEQKYDLTSIMKNLHLIPFELN